MAAAMWTPPRRLMKNRVGVSIAILAVTSVVIFVTLAAMFARLDERQRGMATSVRENALWAAYQADREAGRFVEALALARIEPAPGAVAEAMLRFDVLYSRATMLDYAMLEAQIGGSGDVGAVGRKAKDTILALAPVIDGLGGDDARLRAALPMLLDRAKAILTATHALSLEANAANNAARVAERADMHSNFRTIAGGVVVLTLALVLVAAILIVQLVHISRTGRRLEVLSERNARAAEAAEAGNKAKTAFLATMSHEIRTPLNGIIGMADVLAVTDLSPEQAEQVGVIRQSGDLLLDVINDVLDFSKLEAGMVEIALTDFALADTIETVRAIMAPRAAAKGLVLEVDAPDVTITSDPALLRQVLVNLVGNAIKFTAAGSVRVVVRAEEDARISVVVEDTGDGIVPEAIPRLFREFSQVDGSVTRRFGGTGLGLAICKRLIEALGGRIGVRSVPGHGSRFWFEAPAGSIRPAAPRAAAAAPAADPEGAFAGRVLVVEDNAVNRKVACGLLERAGLAVDCAADGREALERTADRSYDLVLMDMQMPVLDGLSATREMRARGYAAPIVGLTANAFVSDREACLAAGMDDFMSKPITWAKLRDLLRAWLPEHAPGGAGGVDARHRDALTRELGADVVRALIGEFAAESLRMVAEARAARAAGDEPTVDRALHTIKGAGQTLGFVEIGKLAQAARDPAADPAILDRIEALVRATIPGEPERLCA